MKTPDIYCVNTIEELLEQEERFMESFTRDGIYVIRGLVLDTEEKHLNLVYKLGKIYNWGFRDQGSRSVISRVTHKEHNTDGDQKVFLPWHLEHVEATDFPIFSGVWNMINFKAPPTAGATLFYDALNLYRNLKSDDQKFLNKCVVAWDQFDLTGPYYTPAVSLHPWMKVETIRMDVDESMPFTPYLYKFDGKDPSEEQKQRFSVLQKHVTELVNTDTENQYRQNWQEFDIAIIDIYRMYHAVVGGFSRGQREFMGTFTKFGTDPVLKIEDHSDFYIISNVLSSEESKIYTKYFMDNAVPDTQTHRDNMLFFGLGGLDIEDPTATFEADILADGTRLANIIRYCKEFISNNYELDAPLEFKRAFVHIMQEGTEIESHNDDGDIYQDKPEGEKHYSAVLVFNEDYEGGEFHFSNLGWSSTLSSGSLVVFRGDHKRLHGVHKIISGYRVSMPIFFRTVSVE